MWTFLFFISMVTQVFCEQPVVVTPKGPVRGQDEGNYTTFFGVPYARVVEETPFGVSVPHPDFVVPFEASDPSVKCPQAVPQAQGTLQCLRLNIYVPKMEDQVKVPVLVWFHGGGYVSGSAGNFDGKYLVQQNIIVVTANYRLGPYGFFCLNDPKVPGNQGLKDQVEALKWVQNNIGAFGGDPTKVTIAGESFGGGSVDLHFYSKFLKYFDKAIVQSGGAEVEGMFVKPDHKAPIKLAKLFNYVPTNNSDALEFLAKVNPLELMTVFKSSNLVLRACKEKKFKSLNVQNFLTKDPFHLYQPMKILNTPVLFGYNSKETFSMIAEPDPFFENEDIFFDKLNSAFHRDEEDLRKVADILKMFYLGSKPVSKENKLAVLDFLADFKLNYAAESSVNRLVEQGALVYKYLFSYTGNSPFKNITGVGAFHTEELQYLFPYNNKEVTEPDDVLMKDRMTTMWGYFVKYGNPTPDISSLLPVRWTPVPRSARPYMIIDLEMSMLEDVYHQRIALWNLLWHNYWKKSKIRKGHHHKI